MGLLLICSLLLNLFTIRSCYNYKSQGDINVIALTDTIHYYKSKNGDLVASKYILEGDLNTLKIVNDSLYNVVKDMKVNKPISVVYVDGVIKNELKDTVWVITKEELTKDTIRKDFVFNNNWRLLEGQIEAVDSTLGLQITKDQYNFDYTVAIENNQVKIKSSNPYVKYNEITGIQIPKNKKPTWAVTVGPSIFGGINPTNGKSTWGVGGSITIGWTPFSW